ncbi:MULTISPECIES: ScbA/BarX family gamma-butyrolactone biosynthesis protein [unclassified Streptomyces]|uniref:ScbA/BarX family gamma-butyrolactone biosynthesis protein n=1 Tax=unclassified Streptomyces TaxID=2593676 RepID=UPI000998CFFC|nr:MULTISPECIES: ScbA/BarX family gamma-butyrolactone biosynthesis protein [unclassified Streptomyces]MYT32031.1 transcriptional regulator [Streptomyces sp. SID8354]
MHCNAVPATTRPSPVAFVPKKFVHKTNSAEVLLTGWQRTDTNAFTVFAHWPTTHSFYTTGPSPVDPLLLTETIRQMFPLLCHGAYNVPFDHHLLWEHYRYELTPHATQITDRAGPLNLHVECQEKVHRGTRLAALTLAVTVVRHEVPLATAHTRFTIQPPAIYHRLRAGRTNTAPLTPTPPPPCPIPPHDLGRRTHADILLSPSDNPHRWALRIDTTHPILFDHPLDHAPGILLLEAARQAAQALTPTQPMTATAMHNTFSRYIEYDTPCWIEAHPLPPTPPHHHRTAVTLTQDNIQRYTTTITHTPTPTPPPHTHQNPLHPLHPAATTTP